MNARAERLSLRAYARHRKANGLIGGTPAAVHKAVKTNRITVDENGLIDPKAADAEWAQNSTPRVRTARREAAVQTETEVQGARNANSALQADYLEARSRKEWALARTREAELHQMHRELVTTTFLRDQVSRILIALCDALDTLPVTLPARIEAARGLGQRRGVIEAAVDRIKAELAELGASLAEELHGPDDAPGRDRSVA